MTDGWLCRTASQERPTLELRWVGDPQLYFGNWYEVQLNFTTESEYWQWKILVRYRKSGWNTQEPSGTAMHQCKYLPICHPQLGGWSWTDHRVWGSPGRGKDDIRHQPISVLPRCNPKFTKSQQVCNKEFNWPVCEEFVCRKFLEFS